MGIYNRKDNCVENWQESVRTTQLSTHTRTHHRLSTHTHTNSNLVTVLNFSLLKVNLTKPRKLLNPELSNET